MGWRPPVAPIDDRKARVREEDAGIREHAVPVGATVAEGAREQAAPFRIGRAFGEGIELRRCRTSEARVYHGADGRSVGD